ncbi:MAG: hypothetical protein M1548_02295 [Actinobacteria bacterium]|nr:hypothetical protein [Actinomycetota bacterium]
MSIVRNVGKVAIGAAFSLTLAAGAAVGFATVVAFNPNMRRRVSVKALRAFEGLLKRAGGAIEAGRYAAQIRERELERLLEVEPTRQPRPSEPDYIV